MLGASKDEGHIVNNTRDNRTSQRAPTRADSSSVIIAESGKINWYLRMVSMLSVLAIFLAASACQEYPTSKTEPAANTNAQSNAPAASGPATSEPAPSKPESAGSKNVAPTLPVLDAFFAQEKFADELKAKLKLTDQQIEKLRTIARQETAKLREGNSDDEYSGKASAARDEAVVKITATIGEQNTKDLIAFVNERWSGGDTAAGVPPSSAPGAAPTNAAPNTAPSTAPSTAPNDTRIVVNAPAFRMDIFEDGRLIKSYKIGIGYPEFPLPTGLRKADTIILNPTWTPPDEPWVESSNSSLKVGEKVPAGSKLNPLGPIKIPIGFPSLIHGGKAPAKLGSFASHGCVGLTTPQIQEFAGRLANLSGTQLSREQIAEYLKRKTETKAVKLARSVPVELRYDTITVEDGKLHIYRDVYERGTNTEENLRAVLQANGMSFDKLSDSTRAEAMTALNAMSRNASGKPVSDTASSSARNKNTGGKVTRLIKGAKEAVIDIPDLAGKGYPAPVDLDTGTPRKAPAARRRR